MKELEGENARLRKTYIDEQQLADLSCVLIAIYGNKYTGHPRIQSLME
ncbi:hypothetical protein [Burkholderia lata]|nr:hypothetical protein [Burkholderia lata]